MPYSFANRGSPFWNVLGARLSFLGSMFVIGSLSVFHKLILGPLSYSLFIDDMPTSSYGC